MTFEEHQANRVIIEKYWYKPVRKSNSPFTSSNNDFAKDVSILLNCIANRCNDEAPIGYVRWMCKTLLDKYSSSIIVYDKNFDDTYDYFREIKKKLDEVTE